MWNNISLYNWSTAELQLLYLLQVETISYGYVGDRSPIVTIFQA